MDTKRSFSCMHGPCMEPGQRILKVHGNSQQIADCLTKIMTPQAAHERIGVRRDEVQKITTHQVLCTTHPSQGMIDDRNVVHLADEDDCEW